MDSTPELFDELKSRLASVLGELALGAPISQHQIESILDRHEETITTWVERYQENYDPDVALEKLQVASADLILWDLYTQSEDSELQKQLIEILWTSFEKTIRHQARAMVRNIGNKNREEERLKDLMQEGYLKFHDKLVKYNPANSRRTNLRTFISTVYRREFINISKSKVMSDGIRVGKEKAKSLPTAHDQTDDRGHDEQLRQTNREAVDLALDNIASRGERESEKVKAYKMALTGMANKEVAKKMKRSEKWASTSRQHVLQLLKDELES